MMRMINDIAALERYLNEETDPVVVEFWATWCKPCAILDLQLDHLSKLEGSGLKFVRFDVGSETVSISRFRVHFLPTLMLFQNGKLLETKVGTAAQTIVENWINENAPEVRA